MARKEPPAERRYCNFTKKNGKPCHLRAGAGTHHKGSGCCWKHGGRGGRPITHGRYSSVVRPSIKQEMDRLAKEKDPLNLSPELLMLRAVLSDYLKRVQKGELKEFGIDTTRDLIKDIGSLVDKIQKNSETKSISLETFRRVMEQMGITVAKHVTDKKILRKIEKDWGSIRLDASPAQDQIPTDRKRLEGEYVN